tara:strand:- start:3567 stop:3698 length:132 start_codon:yes stop_codon:yes gene_type:complete
MNNMGYSDCCAEEVYEDYMICSGCNDHCGYQEEDDVDYDEENE